MPKNNPSKKILVILMTLGIYLAAIPIMVSASPGIDLVTGIALSQSGSGTAEWSIDSTHSGVWGIHMTAPGQPTWNGELGVGEGVNEGRISLMLAPGTTLGDIESISWWVNTTSGYPPHVDLILDLDENHVFDGGKKDIVTGGTLIGNDDVLVAEFAYQPYVGPGYEYVSPGIPYGHYDPGLQGSNYNPAYDSWVRTFQNNTAEKGTKQFNNDTICWLYSGLPGPYAGGYFGTLADFKDGTVQVIGGVDYAPVSKTTLVLEIQIEVDNWIGSSDAYVDDIGLNDELLLSELLPPEIIVVDPEPMIYDPGDIPVEITAHDLFGVEEIWFNVKKSNGKWLYAENQTYTDPTSMHDLRAGDYVFYAWAQNTLGVVGMNSDTRFSVRRLPPEELMVDIHPETLNLKSNGRWVTCRITPPPGYSVEDIDIESLQLVIDDENVPPEWGKVVDGVLMVKFSRSALKELLSPGDEVEITVIGELADDSSFEGSDTIRVIYPGSKGLGPVKNGPRFRSEKNNHNRFNLRWNRRWEKGNNGNAGKNKKNGKK